MTGVNKAKVLSIIPHVSGPLSVIGSASIVYDILRDRKNKVKRPYYRIMLVMSIVDGLSSSALAFSTLPIPAGTVGVYGAVGTTQSCTTQGFFIQLMMISPLYNLILSTYYLLLGKYHMSEEEIARRYEKNMHVAAITIGVGFAILGLPLKLYNNANLWCWIASYPSNCETDSGEPGPVQCERGKHAWLFRWLIFYGPIWVAILCVVIIMIMLTRSVQSEEKKFVMMQDGMRRKGLSGDEEHKLSMDSPSRSHSEQNPYDARYERSRYERSKQIFRQAVFYVVVFLLTWIFVTINRMYQLITGGSSFPLLVLHSIFGPLQGEASVKLFGISLPVLGLTTWEGFLNFVVFRHGKVTA